MIGNLPDGLLYDLLPPVVQNTDVRLLINSVVGGFQDRVADLRYWTANISNLMDPWSGTIPLPSGALAPHTILCSYVQQNQVEVTIPLTDDGTAPPDGPALLTWCASQLQLDPTETRVVAAVTGSDALRTLSVNQIELLAETLGATLYPGLDNELPAETASRQAQIVQSYFPRLKIKGTASSFAALARLCGYHDGSLVPLWSRISPRSPDLTVVSVGDFNSIPDFYPTAALPDDFYDPTKLRDGPWYFWQSGSLYPSATSSSYYTSVNGNNPFITIAPTANALAYGSITGLIQAGTYVLAGGAAQTYATVPFDSGYYSSSLQAQALAPGDTFNGLAVMVTTGGGGSWSQISVLDQLSTIKFRSSYFDANVALEVPSAGTVLSLPNTDLENGLVVSDGSSTAPWRSWGGGQGPSYVLHTWPETVSILNPSVPVTPRAQVPISSTQLDMDGLVAGAQRVLALAQDDCIAATRLPRHLGAGVVWDDPATFAPYTSVVPINYSNGSNYKVVADNTLPTGPVSVNFILNGVPVPSETFGSLVLLETQYLTGSYNLSSQAVTVFAQAGAAGNLALYYTKLDNEMENSEPGWTAKEAGDVAYQDVPAGTWVPPSPKQSSANASTVSPFTYMTADDIPWPKISLLAGGDAVDQKTFVPVQGDPAPISTASEMDWLDQGNNPMWLRVIDTPGAPMPYQVQAIDNPTPGPINPAYGLVTYVNGSNLLASDIHGIFLATQWGSTILIDGIPSQPVIVPMRLVGNLPISTCALSPARTDNLLWWWPLTETANESLTVTEAMTQVEVPLVNALPTDRSYGPVLGWKLKTYTGVATSPALSFASSYALGVRLAPTTVQNPYVQVNAPVVTAGNLSVTIASASSAYASLNIAPGTTVSTGTQALASNLYNYVYTSYYNGTLSFAVRQDGNGVFAGTAISVPTPLTTSPYVSVTGANPLTAVQDLCVWNSGTKSTAQLTAVDTPNFTSTAVPVNLPFSYSLRGDRYAFAVLSQGFAQPTTLEQPNQNGNFIDTTVVRYMGDGSYQADPRFKRTGLGENQPLPGVWRLGTQAGQPIMATGQAVMAGTQAPLPVFTTSFRGTAGSIDWLGPVPSPIPASSTGGTVYETPQGGTLWQQDLNAVLDRIYLIGSDGSSYECYVDNLGYGPIFVSSLVVRDKLYSQNGVITADCPTDRMAAFFSGGSIIIPSHGTVTTVMATSAGSIGYPYDAYMYSNSQLVATVDNPLSILTDPTPFALQEGVAALDSAGDMTFIMDQYAGGPAPLLLNFLVGNIGQLDPDFAGFFVTITVEAPNMTPVSVPAVLLPNGTGVNPQAWQTVSVPITTSLTGTWRISIDWTNDRTVPSRGWARQLAIYAFTARVSLTNLVHITTQPLSLNSVSVYSPATVLQPGAWVAHVTNSGSVYAASHESLTYSPVIDNAFNYPVNPASNSLTGTSAARFSDLRTVTSYPLVNHTPIAPPSGLSVIASPSGPINYLYNVGQSVTLSASVNATQPRYVWNLWNAGTVGTINPTITQQFLSGGTQFGYLTVVDAIGQTASWTGTFVVNSPPLINAAQAFPNDQVVPYTTSLQAFVTPGTNPYVGANPYQAYWVSPAGSTFALGTLVPSYTVANQAQSVTVVAYDPYGGTSTVPLYLAGEAPNPPVISVADYTANAYVNTPMTLNFAALGADPQNEILTPLWTFWDGGTTSGFAQPLVNFGTGSLFTATRIVNVANPGYYTFQVSVTDTNGLTSTAGAGVNFTVNVPPYISSCQVVTGPQITAGQPVNFAAVAVDPEGNPLSYSWYITPGNVTLLGPNVSYVTTGLAVGTVITATLSVNDGFGGVATQTLPGVTVNAQGLANVTIHPPSSELTGGINVIITPPSNFNISTGNIQYTVNGITPQQSTDGTTYQGPFQVTGTSGQTVIVQARAFQSGFTPSVVATSTYTFA